MSRIRWMIAGVAFTAMMTGSAVAMRLWIAALPAAAAMSVIAAQLAKEAEK